MRSATSPATAWTRVQDVAARGNADRRPDALALEPSRNDQSAGQAGLGIGATFLYRKRYVEDILRQALDTDIGAVVILGAGFDTLAYRTSDLGSKVPVYAVDLPANIERKQPRSPKSSARNRRASRWCPSTGAQDLNTVLYEHGYHHAQKTFFVWVAVTHYKTEQGVGRTMRGGYGTSGSTRRSRPVPCPVRLSFPRTAPSQRLRGALSRPTGR